MLVTINMLVIVTIYLYTPLKWVRLCGYLVSPLLGVQLPRPSCQLTLRRVRVHSAKRTWRLNGHMLHGSFSAMNYWLVIVPSITKWLVWLINPFHKALGSSLYRGKTYPSLIRGRSEP